MAVSGKSKSIGKSSGEPSRKERGHFGPPAGETWLWLTPALLLSPTLNHLSSYGRSALNWLLAEHAYHRGTRNGQLQATYDQLVKHMQIPRKFVRAALWELEAMGLLRVSQRGGRNASSKYRLTFYAWSDGEANRRPTNEWQKIRRAQAEGIARDAARMRSEARGVRKSAIKVPPGGTSLDPPGGTKEGPD